jgi:hypothetical protein
MKYDTPVYLISLSEIYFFLSEYYEKVKNNAVQAKAYYEAAIVESFKTAGLTAADAASVIAAYPYGSSPAAGAGSNDRNLGIQKWVALACINGFESWCELRRLGYPAFNAKTGAEIYAKWDELATANVTANKPNPTPLAQDLIDAGVYTTGTIFTPVYVVGLEANTLLGRLPYVTSSRTTNSNVPKQKNASDKVFWAK